MKNQAEPNLLFKVPLPKPSKFSKQVHPCHTAVQLCCLSSGRVVLQVQRTMDANSFNKIENVQNTGKIVPYH